MATLIVFGDAADGCVQQTHATTYLTAARTGGTLTLNPASTDIPVGNSWTGSEYLCAEGFIAFDTSVLSGQTVISAQLNMTTYLAAPATDFLVQARIDDWSTTVTTGDWVASNALPTPVQASWDTTGSTGGPASVPIFFTSESTFPSAIVTTGFTRLILNSSRHASETQPSGTERVQFIGADSSGTTNDPFLVVGYGSTTISAVSSSWDGTANKGAQSATTTTLAQVYPPGCRIFVYIASDNAGASGVEAVSSVTDNVGNSYSEVAQRNRTAGNAANDGATATIYTAVVTTPPETITVNWSPDVISKAIAINAFFESASGAAYSTGGNTGSGTTWTGNASTSMTSGDLIVAVCASESATPATADSDTTNGSWVSTTYNSGGTGGDGTKMAVLASYKLITGAGTQEFNSTGPNTDWAVAFGLFHPSGANTVVTPGVVSGSTTVYTTGVSVTISPPLISPPTVSVYAPLISVITFPSIINATTNVYAPIVSISVRVDAGVASSTGTVHIAYFSPEIANLVDDFDTLDAPPWNMQTGSPSIVSGRLLLDGVTSDYVDTDPTFYVLADSSIFAKLEVDTSQSAIDGNATYSFAVYNPYSVQFGLIVLYAGGSWRVQDNISGLGGNLDVAYSASSHRWLRIREAAGTVYWDASTNGASWSNLGSVVHGSATNHCDVYFWAQNAGYLYVDNVNVVTTEVFPTVASGTDSAYDATVTTSGGTTTDAPADSASTSGLAENTSSLVLVSAGIPFI